MNLVALRSGKKINAESLATAYRNGQEWTGPEIEMVMRADLTAREVAPLIGRTVAAVKLMRHHCRVDPRKADFGYWAS